jgi:hypothetical protein
MDTAQSGSPSPGDARAWLLLVAGDNRQHGGNDGYSDEPDAHYTWDNTVANHATVARGDLIALWDKKRLLGVSVITDIATAEDDKLLRRCGKCERAHIKARVTPGLKRYKCFECSAEFDEPKFEVKHVITYRSDHQAAWQSLDGLLDGGELRSLCYSPKSQLSMRPLDWLRFEDAVRARGVTTLGRLSLQSTAMIIGGHRTVSVRARIGQALFRDRLLATSGPVCAMTGPAPAAALEGAHLYSYASIGEHHEHGGLLLRRDIHRLFDDGLIAVDPRALTLDIDPRLAEFPQYASLHGNSLHATLRTGHLKWLRLHWAAHRPIG